MHGRTITCSDHDGLDVDELLDPVMRQLAAKAALLNATEGELGVRLDSSVDEHGAGVDFADGQTLAARLRGLQGRCR